jgi:hypothetical protein
MRELKSQKRAMLCGIENMQTYQSGTRLLDLEALVSREHPVPGAKRGVPMADKSLTSVSLHDQKWALMVRLRFDGRGGGTMGVHGQDVWAFESWSGG